MNEEILTVSDLMKILQCGRTTASKKLQEIKRVSNRLKIKGKCHRLDYELWVANSKEINQNNLNEKLKPILNDLVISLKRTTNLLEKLME
jgi:DNA-binding transcriptional regulator GbsR (MarR family)